MGKIKLFYFNARGRAELSRLILAQAGQDYEDVSIQKEEWPEMKPSKISYYYLNFITAFDDIRDTLIMK